LLPLILIFSKQTHKDDNEDHKIVHCLHKTTKLCKYAQNLSLSFHSFPLQFSSYLVCIKQILFNKKKVHEKENLSKESIKMNKEMMLMMLKPQLSNELTS